MAGGRFADGRPHPRQLISASPFGLQEDHDGRSCRGRFCSRALADAVVTALAAVLVECEAVRFPDGELRPVAGHVRGGGDVYEVRPAGPQANDHLMELFLLFDACRRGGADRSTAVVPASAAPRRTVVPGRGNLWPPGW
ncbi:ribose-phosphate pyrophosphokinase-like domain-containing protein [Streptomyces sp. JV185]|uniref:ribose-phosphate pyrophosphokinase-like domain-containing protein n=1 Tax=Streptomyces sp. JV185 TaxID=858638 RepID=UPI003FA732FE